MLYGVVSKVITEKRFGFIKADFGPDVFFHRDDLVFGDFASIAEGQPVSYEVERPPRNVPREERKGPRAKQVRVIPAIPGGKIEETDPIAKAKHHPNAKRKKPKWRYKEGDFSYLPDEPSSEPGSEPTSEPGGNSGSEASRESGSQTPGGS